MLAITMKRTSKATRTDVIPARLEHDDQLKHKLIERLMLINVATGGCGGMTQIDPPSI